MRRLALIAVLPALVLAAGCGKKDSGPKGPFVPLVERLPADAPLVVMVDIAKLFSVAQEAERGVKQIPILARHPKLLGMIEQQIAVGRASLVMLKGRLGLDPTKDLARAAVAFMLPPDGSMELVAVVEGEFPPDFFARLFPDAASEKVAGRDVYATPGPAKLALVERRLLVAASSARLPAALSAKGGSAQKLAERHPGLFDDGATETLLSASLLLPAEVGRQLEAVPGLGVFAGVRQVTLSAGQGMKLTATSRDDETVDHVRAVFEAWAEMLASGQHMLRGLGYWALVFDLDELVDLDGLPPALGPALADREALLSTLESLLPEPSGPPPVKVEGRRVSLVTDPQALKGVGFLIGLGASIAVPAVVARQRADADAELERALLEAQRFDGKGDAK